MKFSEIKHKIKNLGDFKSLEEIKKAGLRIVRNTKTGDYWLIEEEFLKPVVKSLRELSSIDMGKLDFKYKVISCDVSKEKLINERRKILDYILWGEREGFNKRPTVKNRLLWYYLDPQDPGDFIFSMTYGERYLSPINRGWTIDAAIYNVYIKPSYRNSIEFFKVYFNSSLLILLIEIYCRVMTGALPLAQMKVYEWSFVDVVVLSSERVRRELYNSSNLQIFKRPIHSIFIELGFDSNKPIREQEPNPLPDRKALDDVVFDALGLTEEERKEVYWAVAELVQNRLKKAKSV